MQRFFGFLLGAFFLISCDSEKPVLRVAAAANTQYVLKEIVTEFEKVSEIKTELILGSSGKLNAQITKGAPFDVFISADTKNPSYLHENGFTQSEPKVYGMGRLVLWSTSIPVDSLRIYLKEKKIEKLASANPVTAPYGVATEEFLTNAGLFEYYSDKLVFGESISQTNLFITSGAVDAGFTALSIVVSDEMKGRGFWVEVEKEFYSAIEQSAVLLTDTEEARKFYEFLYSNESRKIFEEFGYFTP